jgi:glucokinase
MRKLCITLYALTTMAICHGAAESHVVTPGTIVIRHGVKLSEKSCTYILACKAGRFEINAGIFAVKENKPFLTVDFHTPAQDIAGFSADRLGRFALYIKALLDYVQKEFSISVTQACIGAGGPTAAGRDIIDAPHAPFGVSAHEIKKHTCLEQVFVINDFETTALGIEAVDSSYIVTLLPGAPRERGTKLIIGAGAGLGSGLLLWNDKLGNYMPSPLNYSFTEFNPQSELELRYNDFLKRTSNNAWGKVLGSSAGIVDMYNFLHEPKSPVYQHAAYQEIFNKRDTDSSCKAAVDMYMKLYIRLMRNAMYAQASHAGLYITNTIAEQNPSLFTDSAFKVALLYTGDLTNAGNKYLHDYLQEIPVYLVTAAASDLALYGAAFYAIIHGAK